MAFLPPVELTVKVEPKKRAPVLHDIKITSPNGLNPRGTNLTIDGEPCIIATAVKFEITAENFAKTEIAIISHFFDFEGKSELSIDPSAAALLVKLGWTPPANG